MANNKSKGGKTVVLSLARPGSAPTPKMPSADDWVKNSSGMDSRAQASTAAAAEPVAAPAPVVAAEPVAAPAPKPAPAPAPAKQARAKAASAAPAQAKDELPPRFTLSVEKEMFQNFSIYCVRSGIKKMHFFRDYSMQVRDNPKLADRIVALSKSHPVAAPQPDAAKRISVDLSSSDKEYMQTLCIRADVTMTDFWRTAIAESIKSMAP